MANALLKSAQSRLHTTSACSVAPPRCKINAVAYAGKRRRVGVRSRYRQLQISSHLQGIHSRVVICVTDTSLQLGAQAIYRQRAFACICSRAARSVALAHGKLGVAACAEQRQRVVALARSSIYITTPAEHWQPVQRPFVCRLYGRRCHVGCETAVCSITSGYGLLICVCSLEQSTQCCVCWLHHGSCSAWPQDPAGSDVYSLAPTRGPCAASLGLTAT